MRWNKLGLFIPALLVSSSAIGQKNSLPSEHKEKQNVLFLIIDDLRPELGCYGASYMHTPNIDRLARQGVMFQNAYCNVPVSGASRASLMTGIRPGINRFWDVTAKIDEQVPGTVTLPQHFRENGYVTIANSKIIHDKDDASVRSWDEVWFPKLNSQTWRDYCTEENRRNEKRRGGSAAYECADVIDEAYGDGKTAEKTIQDLRKLAKSDKPFFLAAGIVKPHLPFNAPKKYWDLYDEEKITLPATWDFDTTGIPNSAFHKFGEIRYYKGIPQEGKISEGMALKLIHGYRAAVSYADAQVGKILKELKRLKLDKNTIVVLLGDHGWSLGDHDQWCKHSNFKMVCHAPLIIRVPDNPKRGVEEKVAEFVDVYPTLCEAAGLECPAHLEGESLLPVLRGEKTSWKDCAIVKWHSGLTYFDRQWGYTQWMDPQGNFLDEMLFDYSNDPEETKNVAGESRYQQIIQTIREKMLQHRGPTFMVKVPVEEKPWK